MKLTDAIGFVKKSKGRFVSLEFVKRTDGTVRRMLFRTGVKRGLTGKGMSYDAESKGLLTVWDRHKKAYRMVPLDNITRLHIKGEWIPVTKE